MAKSRNRSRDIKKRAAKKRANKERIARRLKEIAIESKMLMDIGQMLQKKERPKFSVTHCSQCGAAFGQGNSGYSHCIDHKGIPEKYED